MGLKTLVSRGSYFARLGTYVRGYHGGFAPNPAVGFLDPVAAALQGVPMDWGWFEIEPALNLYPNLGSAEWVDVARTKPRTSAYDSGRDLAHYGSFLSSLTAVNRLLHGVPYPAGVPAKERNTWHPGVRGTVGPALSGLEYFADQELISSQLVYVFAVRPPGPGFRARLPSGGLFRTQVVCTKSFPNDVFATYDPPGADPDWAPRRSVLSTLEDMMSGLYLGSGTSLYRPFNWGGGMYITLTLDDLSVKETQVSLSYRLRVVSTNPAEIGDVLWSKRLTLSHQGFGSPTEHLTMSETRSLKIPSPATHLESWETTCVSSTRPDRSQVWFGPAGAPGYAEDITNLQGTRGTGWVLCSDCVMSEANDRPISIRSLEKNLGLSDFEFEVSRRIDDIRPASFISTSSAFGEIEDTSSNNLIETLVQLGGIGEYLPRLHEVIAIFTDLRGGRPFRALGEVVDFATELQLRAAFTYGPDIRFIQETVPRLGSIAGQLSRRGNEEVVGRGSFDFNFPSGEFGRRVSSLEVRTKVVARRDYDSVLSKVLGVDALGLLPTASNAWDLIPLSFVLDWFVGLGDRLKDIERNALLVALGPTYLVHSYLIRSPLEDDELERMGVQRFGIAGTGSTEPELRVYVRDVSLHPPPPRDSRYDFHMPSRLPFWATATSLLWQLAK